MVLQMHVILELYECLLVELKIVCLKRIDINYKGSYIWDMLPMYIRNASTSEDLKKTLTNYLS